MAVFEKLSLNFVASIFCEVLLQGQNKVLSLFPDNETCSKRATLLLAAVECNMHLLFRDSFAPPPRFLYSCDGLVAFLLPHA